MTVDKPAKHDHEAEHAILARDWVIGRRLTLSCAKRAIF